MKINTHKQHSKLPVNPPVFCTPFFKRVGSAKKVSCAEPFFLQSVTFYELTLLLMLLTLPSWVRATTLVTQDQTIVTTFQVDKNILNFDAIPPNGGGGASGNTGTPIQIESQLTDQFVSKGVVFSSTAGVVGVVSSPTDAHSPFNVIGGSSASTPLPILNYLEPILIQFVIPNTSVPTTVSSVGAWNDPTGSRILLSVFDKNGNLLESVEADEGFFIAISNPLIASATFSHVFSQASVGFSLDDVTFSSTSGALNTIKRRDMAEPLLKMKFGSNYAPLPATGQVYVDVQAGDAKAKWIEDLKAKAFTEDCETGSYCPDMVVTKEQLAKVFVKTVGLSPPQPSMNTFADVPNGSFARDFITVMRDNGNTTGCDTNKYCPKQAVTVEWFDAIIAAPCNQGPLLTFFLDQDQDTFGDTNISTQACVAPDLHVSNSFDCDDQDDSISPNAVEVCNGIDDDCNGVNDDGGAVASCADGDDCTIDVCGGVNGCINTPIPGCM